MIKRSGDVDCNSGGGSGSGNGARVVEEWCAGQMVEVVH